MVFTDDFNRADEELGASADWSEITGDIDVVSNTAQSQTSGRDVAVAQHAQASDMYAEAQISMGSSGIGGVLVRNAPDSQDGYYGEVNDADNEYKIFRVEAGSNTLLNSKAVALSAPDVLVRLEISGSDLELFIDGVSELTATDGSPITPGNYAGIRNFGSTTVTWDNFETDALGAGAALLRIQNESEEISESDLSALLGLTSLLATETQTIVDVVNELDNITDLHLSVDDDPTTPDDDDWVNNAVDVVP